MTTDGSGSTQELAVLPAADPACMEGPEAAPATANVQTDAPEPAATATVAASKAAVVAETSAVADGEDSPESVDARLESDFKEAPAPAPEAADASVEAPQPPAAEAEEADSSAAAEAETSAAGEEDSPQSVEARLDGSTAAADDSSGDLLREFARQKGLASFEDDDVAPRPSAHHTVIVTVEHCISARPQHHLRGSASKYVNTVKKIDALFGPCTGPGELKLLLNPGKPAHALKARVV